jgi:uncharacterized protein YqgC (DUF456 family)
VDWSVAVLWVAAAALVLVGVAGTVLPALPGPVLVLAGLCLVAWMDDFARVGGWTLAVLAVLTALTYAVDFAASALGAKRVGASRRAIAGALIGGLVGLFFGLPGVLLGPFVGAVVGEYTVQRNLEQAGRVGVGTWVGMALGLAARIALVFAMLAVFATAYLV